MAATGRHNIPDGEVFSCPVKESVEGPLLSMRLRFIRASPSPIFLKFKSGRIVHAEVPARRLNAILDSDEGARYIGEFAIGFNPHILEPGGYFI